MGMLIAYDLVGNVVGTLDYVVSRDARGNVRGLVDFAAHERTGGDMTDVWTVQGAKGSKVWPEWLGGRAHDYRVELVGAPGAKIIGALIDRRTGARRERSAIEAAIEERILGAGDAPADIRDIVGGPDRPLAITADGLLVALEGPGPELLPVLALSREPH